MFGNIVDTNVSMPSDASTQVFNISNLETKWVILYPTRAHITRQIDNVLLEPGSNTVEIYGLSPTVDEHSIQIESQGIASIVDLTIELVPNHDIFDEVYPDVSDTTNDESDMEFIDSNDEKDAVKSITDELKQLQLQITDATETQNSAIERLSTLDRYARSASAEHLSPDDISIFNRRYEEERQTIFKVHSEASQRLLELKKQVRRKEYQKKKAGKEAKNEKAQIRKQKVKEHRKKELQKAENKKQAKYLRQERLRYWPKKVYKITLVLENASIDTPSSSRRESMDSVTLASASQNKMKLTKTPEGIPSTLQATTSLLLSYITKEVGWTPRYDIRISSLQKSATIVYRAEFLNRTSETWNNTKVSFSTSQTSYQGLEDVVPFMHAWRIKLSRYDSSDGGLLSKEETSKTRSERPDMETTDRAKLFGVDDHFVPVWQFRPPQHDENKAGLFSNAPKTGGLFGSSASNNHSNGVNTSLFGSSHSQPTIPYEEVINESVQPSAQLDGAIMSAKRSSRSVFRRKAKSNDQSQNENDGKTELGQCMQEVVEDEGHESMDFEGMSWEDNGLTATYEIPGVRTIPPSSVMRRHKIVSLNAKNIHLSHISIPKLRSAAFLRAKIRNPSSTVTLLKGSTGVTLDGSFLGNMNLQRVSPGQIFDLSLGVDPAIHVNYPKPSVHRSTQGMVFNKENAQVFTRSIWLNNTKAQPIELLLLDQIPVSEDERLKISITTPKGLVKAGDAIKTGISAKEGSSGVTSVVKGGEKPGDWGSATAKLKKNGEVAWTVKIEGGKGCLLKLEYEARLPSGEKIVCA